MNKTALVIGGTTGLGQEIARIAASHDAGYYAVTVVGRTAATCELVRNKVAAPLAIDLEARYYKETLPESVGPYDLIVWAAGMQQRGSFVDLTVDDIRRNCRVQFESPVEILTELLRRQRKAGKPTHLAVISSTTSWRARADEALYGALKAAQSQLARSLGVGLAKDLPGSKVLLVNPGGMATPFWKNSEDVSRFMDPAVVATIIWFGALWIQQDPFEEIQILRQPDGSAKLERGARLPTF